MGVDRVLLQTRSFRCPGCGAWGEFSVPGLVACPECHRDSKVDLVVTATIVPRAASVASADRRAILDLLDRVTNGEIPLGDALEVIQNLHRRREAELRED